MASVGDLWQKLNARQVKAARDTGKKRYEARWRDASGKSRKKAFATQPEAWAWATAHEGEHDGGKIAATPHTETPEALRKLLLSDHPEALRTIERMKSAGALTVAHAMEVHLFSKRHLSPRGLENARLHAGWVVAGLGEVSATALTKVRVEDWLASDPGVAPSSWGKRLSALRSALKLAGVADPSAGIVVKLMREPMDFLTLEELTAVARAVKDVTPSLHGPKGQRRNAHMWQALVLFLGLCGPRLSEALSVRIGDIEPKRARVLIRGTKTAASRRFVPVPQTVMERFVFLSKSREPSEWLFATSVGTQIGRERVGERVREASLRALGRQIRTHDLRHTAATHLIEAGGLMVASKVLGHANPGITATLYGHVTQKAIDSAVGQVGRELMHELEPFGSEYVEF